MLVIDTNILIEIEKRNEKIVGELMELKKSHPQNISITSAVYAEFLFGFLKIKKEKEAEKYLQNCEIINFDKESAVIFANTKKTLEEKGASIPVLDILTASCVISKGATFVTLDNHFDRIPNLKTIILKT